MPEPLRPAPDNLTRVAVRAWNLMNGIDWQALPAICEMLGVHDPEILIHQLCALRDWQRETSD